MNQMQQADHGPAIANHDDGLQAVARERHLSQGHARGHCGRTTMSSVDGMQVREEGIGQTHAADVGGQHHGTRWQTELFERVAQLTYHKSVAASLTVGKLCVAREIGGVSHQTLDPLMARAISSGVIMLPILLIPRTCLPASNGDKTVRY